MTYVIIIIDFITTRSDMLLAFSNFILLLHGVDVVVWSSERDPRP